MSIRQSPELTPQLLDAARANGRHSHGPVDRGRQAKLQNERPQARGAFRP